MSMQNTTGTCAICGEVDELVKIDESDNEAYCICCFEAALTEYNRQLRDEHKTREFARQS